MSVVVYVVNLLFEIFVGGRLGILVALIAAVITYAICLLKFGGLSEDEILEMPKGATLLTIFKKLHLINDKFY